MRRTLTLGAVMLAAVAAGCGSDDTPAADEGGTTELEVGTTGIATDAALKLGIEKGFFKREGIRLHHRIAGGGAALVPALVAGDYDIGSGNYISVFQAQEQGLPIQIVSGVNEAQTEARAEEDISAIVVPQGSPIRDAKQLEGKTIAVNAVKNLGDLTIREALEKRGVDSSKVKFTEIQFPEMLSSLAADRIDAAWILEPFLTIAGDDVRVLMRPFVETAPRFPLGGFFVNERFAEENPDLVERFVRGYRRSVEYATAHPDEQRRIIPTFTEIPPAVVRRMALARFNGEIDVKGLQHELELSQKYGLVEDGLDVEDMVRR
jgi:NitT/TauT family transport system substrate-binding protein